MYPKKTTKKQAKKQKRAQFFLLFLILIFTFINLILLYKIFSPKKVSLISPISLSNLTNGYSFEDKLKKQGIQFSNVHVNGNLYSFEVKDQGMVTFSGSKSIDDQVSSLQLILRRLKIEGKRFKSLDFRYDKPVIVLY